MLNRGPTSSSNGKGELRSNWRRSIKIKKEFPKTILIIDDDDTIRELLAECLGLEGYQVMTAHNGNMGLECLCKNHVSLIILDLQMPVMDGIQFKIVLDSLQEKQAIPVILHTASPKSVPANMRFAAIVHKPGHFPELLDQIRACFD